MLPELPQIGIPLNLNGLKLLGGGDILIKLRLLLCGVPLRSIPTFNRLHLTFQVDLPRGKIVREDKGLDYFGFCDRHFQYVTVNIL